MGNSIESRPAQGSVPYALQTRLTLSTLSLLPRSLCMLERLQEAPQTESDETPAMTVVYDRALVAFIWSCNNLSSLILFTTVILFP
jgi:hypothetical protein